MIFIPKVGSWHATGPNINFQACFDMLLSACGTESTKPSKQLQALVNFFNRSNPFRSPLFKNGKNGKKW
jgi:hypothetical protein